MSAKVEGMSAVLRCEIPGCGNSHVVASGFIALTFTPEKFKACADRIGWGWNPVVCTTCALEERKKP